MWKLKKKLKNELDIIRIEISELNKLRSTLKTDILNCNEKAII